MMLTIIAGHAVVDWNITRLQRKLHQIYGAFPDASFEAP